MERTGCFYFSNRSIATNYIEIQNRKLISMQSRMIAYDVHNWVSDFLNQLQDVKILQAESSIKQLRSITLHKVKTEFESASNRLLFLDYDGTLVPFARHPGE